MAWDRIARSKLHGGIGYRDLHLFNQALIAICKASLASYSYYPASLLDVVLNKITQLAGKGSLMIWRSLSMSYLEYQQGR